MKEIKIFLASSYELEPDRARIGNLIRQLNDECYEGHGIHLHLIKWEDLNSFYNPGGKQNEYDIHIENCELFIGLFWHIAGRHTIHEVEVARKKMLPGNVFIFHKTAEFKPDHDGSEDEKRFLERHPDEKLDESREEFEAYLKEQKSLPYADFNGLRRLLTEKLAESCKGIEFSEEERKRSYSTDALQIHVSASPEAEPDLARLGDLVRYLDENSKYYCRIRLIPEISGSDMFVSLCHTSAPDPMPQKIRTAIDCHSKDNGKPRLYFCMKYVSDQDKQESLKNLETQIGDILKHYPDRYYQSAEMKLHFLLQLEQLKHSFGNDILALENGMICQKSGESKFPLMFCDDMPSLQNDQGYKKLKDEQKQILGEIEKLKAQDEFSTEDLSKEIFRMNQELAEIRQQIDDRRTGYFRLARTLEEMVGREQDEEIVKIRELVGKGMIDEARKLLPKDSAEFIQSVTEELNGHMAKMLRYYDVCLLTIECLRAGNSRKNRDEIFKFYDSLVHQIAPALQDDRKTAEACYSYGCFLHDSVHCDPALEYYGKAMEAWKRGLGENHPNIAMCHDNIGAALSDKGRNDNALKDYEKALAIRLKTLGKKHIDTAASYSNIGAILATDITSRNYDAALQYSKKALNIRLQILGEQHPDTADSYNNIGIILLEQNNVHSGYALQYCKKALNIRLQILGEQHPDTADSYNNIGGIYDYDRDYDRALDFYEKALKIRLQVFGEDHPDVADSYNNIGAILGEERSLHAKALEYYEKALQIRLRTLGENHRDTMESYYNLYWELDANGDHERASECSHKSLELMVQNLHIWYPDASAKYLKTLNKRSTIARLRECFAAMYHKLIKASSHDISRNEEFPSLDFLLFLSRRQPDIGLTNSDTLDFGEQKRKMKFAVKFGQRHRD